MSSGNDAAADQHLRVVLHARLPIEQRTHGGEDGRLAGPRRIGRQARKQRQGYRLGVEVAMNQNLGDGLDECRIGRGGCVDVEHTALPVLIHVPHGVANLFVRIEPKLAGRPRQSAGRRLR